MTRYKIVHPSYVGTIVEEADHVTEASPSLALHVGKPWHVARTDIERTHAVIIPLLDQPEWVEYGGLTYELRWLGSTLVRVTVHRADAPPKDIKASALPKQVREML